MRERDVLDLLHLRYSQTYGNGPRYVCAEHVKSSAGFDATRCADMIVQDLWPSRGLELHGYEVKVSRSDWLTELKHPEKAEEFRRYVHRWWLVVPDAAIVRPGELPRGWGLLAARPDGGLRPYVSAPPLRPEPMPPTLIAALLRAAVKTAQRRMPAVAS
jgi:hypothetical protein